MAIRIIRLNRRQRTLYVLFVRFPIFVVFFVQPLTLSNASEFVDLVTDFCLDTGIESQMNAFRGKV